MDYSLLFSSALFLQKTRMNWRQITTLEIITIDVNAYTVYYFII